MQETAINRMRMHEAKGPEVVFRCFVPALPVSPRSYGWWTKSCSRYGKCTINLTVLYISLNHPNWLVVFCLSIGRSSPTVFLSKTPSLVFDLRKSAVDKSTFLCFSSKLSSPPPFSIMHLINRRPLHQGNPKNYPWIIRWCMYVYVSQKVIS